LLSGVFKSGLLRRCRAKQRPKDSKISDKKGKRIKRGGKWNGKRNGQGEGTYERVHTQ
jgi:hypothetical protein